MSSTLKNKVVLITGASRGIGKETALKFAEEGSRLTVTFYTDKKEGEKVAKTCKRLGSPQVLLVRLDVTDDKSIKDAVKKCIDTFGQIDILINNAGVVVWKDLNNTSFKEIETQIRTNLEGLIKVSKECLPYIKDTIINISSGAGKRGYASLASYCASKFGVRGFTQSLAQELSSVKVFSVNPGSTATRMNDFQGDTPEKVAEVIVNTAKGVYRVGSGADIDVWDYI